MPVRQKNAGYFDRNKRDIAKLQIANSLNEALGYEDSTGDSIKAITSKKETAVGLLKYYLAYSCLCHSRKFITLCAYNKTTELQSHFVLCLDKIAPRTMQEV